MHAVEVVPQSPSTIDPAFANHFANAWFDAWNQHDVERCLSHYAPDFEQTSPTNLELGHAPSGTLVGREALRQHWERILDLWPHMQLEPVAMFLGVASLTLAYRVGPRLASETFHFGGDGLVHEAFFHWAT